MAQRRGSRANAQRQSLARRQADKERRQEQWAQDQTRKLALVDTAYAAANDYMLERYDRAMVDERWISPRGPSETHTSYYQRVGRHQAQIEELARPLRERASNGHTLRPSLEAHGRRGTRPAEPRKSLKGAGTSSCSSNSDSSDSDTSRDDCSESSDAAAGPVGGDSGPLLTTLQQAAADGDEDMVRLLLSRGVDVDGKEGDVSNETALHVAAHFGHQHIVEILLQAGALVDDLDLQGQTPLHAAASSGQEAIARMLLMQGARLNCVDNAGDTPLHCAARYGRLEVVRLLIRGVGRARSGRGRRGVSNFGWHEAQWALSAKNKHGHTPAELSELRADGGGNAVAAVLAEFTASQSAAKAESELRASTASATSLSAQLKEREEECATLNARLEAQEAGALAVQKHLQSVQAKAKAANEARQQALDDLKQAEKRIKGLTEELARTKRKAAAELAAATASGANESGVSAAEAELAKLRSQVRGMVRAHVSRMLTTCPRHGATFDGYQDPLLPPKQQCYRCGCSALLHRMRPPTKTRLSSLPDDTPAAEWEEEDGLVGVVVESRHRQSVADMLHAERTRRGLVGGRIAGLKPQWCSCTEGQDHSYTPTVEPHDLHGAVVAESSSQSLPDEQGESCPVAAGSAVASLRWMGATKSGWGAGGGAPKKLVSHHRRPTSADGEGSATPFERWGYRVTS